MKVLIVEDELMARESLARTIREHFPDLEIIGMTSSVQETLAFLQSNRPELIFMDVELSDGNCFEIFRRTAIEANVVMTTAYDNYAIKAFEAGSVDYLLKPVELSDLTRAVERCRRRTEKVDMSALLSALGQKSGKSYRSRFIVHLGEKIIPLNTSDIAYFYSENKSNYITSTAGARYIFDGSMDSLEEELDPSVFFRISRSCIVSMGAIRSITRSSGGRLQISAEPAPSFEMTVSRARVDDFLKWIE
jgi:two-component system, LytTR family, response regulator